MKKTLALIFSLFLFSSCWFSKDNEMDLQDRHEDFVKGLDFLIQVSVSQYPTCKTWREEFLKPLYEETKDDSHEIKLGIFHKLPNTLTEDELVSAIKKFDFLDLHRFREYLVYRYPLEFPTSTRNLNYFIEKTYTLPECDTTFEEYGFMDALTLQWFQKSYGKVTNDLIRQFLLNYLNYTLTRPYLPYPNLLTNAGLMRVMAERGLLNEEIEYPVSLILSEAEKFHTQSMQAMQGIFKSEGKPTVEEIRAVMVLHKDRAEKTDLLKDQLIRLLKTLNVFEAVP